MFFDPAALSVGAMCTATANLFDVMLSQITQFFGFGPVFRFDQICELIDISAFIPQVNPLG